MTKPHEHYGDSDTLEGIMLATLNGEYKSLRAIKHPSPSEKAKIAECERQIDQLTGDVWRPHPVFLIIMFVKDLFADLWYSLQFVLPFGAEFSPTRAAIDGYLEDQPGDSDDDDEPDCRAPLPDGQRWVPINDDRAYRAGRRILHLCLAVLIAAVAIGWIVRWLLVS
ncbi:MAG: hypothetical protein ABIR91_05660 [Candidatus Saccharimonadales bacterium]